MVKRENGKVWIEDVPTLGWGRGRECTFAGALEAALTVTEFPCDYADIMGLSGLAFRVRWYRGDTGQRWCPSCAVGEFPEEIAAVQKSTGWQLRLEVLLGQDNPQMERFAPDIVASIDAGRPVLAYEERLNFDVVYGYEEDGNTLFLRDYFKGDAPLALPAAKLGPFLIFLREHDEPLPYRTALIESLNVAVRNWRREYVPAERGKYLYGDAALSAWIEDIGKAGNLSEEEKGFLFMVNWWNFDTLEDARYAAVSFLQKGATILESDALQQAAALCQQEAGLLGSVFGRKDAFLGPWSGKSVRDWSAEVRRREQEILSEARAIEAAAIAEIEKGLGAMDR